MNFEIDPERIKKINQRGYKIFEDYGWGATTFYYEFKDRKSALFTNLSNMIECIEQAIGLTKEE